MRMQTAPTLKAAMNVNARRDSRVMDTPTVQVIIIIISSMFHLHVIGIITEVDHKKTSKMSYS